MLGYSQIKMVGFSGALPPQRPFPDMQFDIGNMSDIPNEYVVILPN